MINYLTVKNVSVIENLSLEFKEGLTVLTGETGSGKSVLVGALKLLLGERFQKTMLREGADKLRVEGLFDHLSLPSEFNERYEIDDELIIRREVDDAGKNKIFINGHSATVRELKDFAPYLADIHGQHEHQALLDESRHLALIDHLVDKEVINAYEIAFNTYKEFRTEYKNLSEKLGEIKKHHDIITFQLNEIGTAAIDPEADSRLDDEISLLSNIERVREACAATLNNLSEGEVSAADFVAEALKHLDTVAGVSSELAEAAELLSSALENIMDATKKVQRIFDNEDASPEELDRLNHRKFMLANLMKKYGGSLEAVLEKYASLVEMAESFETSDASLAKLEEKTRQALDKVNQKASILREAREKAGSKISLSVEKILNELELPGSRLKTVITPLSAPDTTGSEEAVFYISVNKGFEPAPLAQVASGGEVSRVMLALKEVFSEADKTPTLLFDEIDTGISGRTAKKVAEKLKALSKTKQIIVITHLPVVAAAGGTHFHIDKNADSGQTRTIVTELSGAERRNTLAAMIAGTPTAASVMQAEELLKWADI